MPPKKRGRPRKNPPPQGSSTPEPVQGPPPAQDPAQLPTARVVLENLTEEQVASLSSSNFSDFMSAVGDLVSQEDDLVEDDQLIVAEEGT